MFTLRMLSLGVLLFNAGLALAQEHPLVAIPPVARVTDLAAVLSAPAKASLEATVATLEKDKGAQVAILIVPTTQPEDIAPFATRVFDAWKLGRKGVDDGVLLIVAKADHSMRIEVGRGLEGAIPDVSAKRIGSDIMAPFFKKEDYAGGISAGVEAIAKLVRGEALPPPASTGKTVLINADGSIAVEQIAYIAIALALLYGCFALLALGIGSVGSASLVGSLSGVAIGMYFESLIAGVLCAVSLGFILLMLHYVGLWNVIEALLDIGSSSSSDDSDSDHFSGGGGSSAGGGASSSW
jgi:uncharacterized protein